MTSAVVGLWVVTLCEDVGRQLRYGGTYFFHLHS